MKLGAKRAELVQLMQKFVPRSHIGITRNNAPDPTHWTLYSYFGAFHSVWVDLGLFHYCTKLGAKQGWTGVINAKVCATKLCLNFSIRTHLIRPIGP